MTQKQAQTEQLPLNEYIAVEIGWLFPIKRGKAYRIGKWNDTLKCVELFTRENGEGTLAMVQRKIKRWSMQDNEARTNGQPLPERSRERYVAGRDGAKKKDKG